MPLVILGFLQCYGIIGKWCSAPQIFQKASYIMSFMPSGLLRPHSSKIAFFHRLLDGTVILAMLALAIELTHDELEFAGQYATLGIWAVLIFLGFGGMRHLYGSSRALPLQGAVSETV